jgi:hypothetical protein
MKTMAGMKQYLQVHHEGWIVGGQVTIVHWVPFPLFLNNFTLVGIFY